MRLLSIAAALLVFTACAKRLPPSESAAGNETAAYSVNPRFSDGASILLAARRVFPRCGRIELGDFWTSEDERHEYVVFFTGREVEGGFESMYWRHLVFVKDRKAHDWSDARVFDVHENRPGPFHHTLTWLEENATEMKAEPGATANTYACHVPCLRTARAKHTCG